MVIEGALEGKTDDHLGYARHDPEGRNGGNSRNGHRAETLLTEAGPVEISVPRDRESSFEPKFAASVRAARRCTREPGRAGGIGVSSTGSYGRCESGKSLAVTVITRRPPVSWPGCTQTV
jgi:hypothetical protein